MSDKLIAKCIKEGGKKGVDLAGIEETGGTKFFTVSFEGPKGDLEMLKYCLEGANKEVDEAAEERKGGAGKLGKALVSVGETQVTVIVHVPAVVADQLDINDWVKIFTYPTSVITDIDEYTKAIITTNDVEKGVFLLKVKDEVITNSFNFLREKSLIPPPAVVGRLLSASVSSKNC
eukprot:GDKI01009458.1.p2 GENE.GDKI01009458.1~~GDKI01009458.1.p2  ORF type:complete len:176 (-),score=63.93 GDKI01009458.1:1-528(-)